ncbi:hypothetical protein NS228_05170 [Methylobacterium indicum]|nr:hypothetical protein NS229_11555 [Methylobacterium indicum]KTS41774.1 hypothetical protein NS228_05170 [Methylobacterium indicum]KTS53129.1 hypothetical protein NS230_07805 [Methylobacterium indicum]
MPRAMAEATGSAFGSDAWMTPHAAAEELGLSLAQVMALIEAGLLVPEACPGLEAERVGGLGAYRRECSR